MKLSFFIFAVLLVSESTAFVTRRQAEEPPAGPPPGIPAGPPPGIPAGPPPGIPSGGPPFVPPSGGECANPATMENFDKTRYVGKWYQYEGIPTFFQPSGTKCVRATYGVNDNGTVSVHNVATKVDGSFTDICGFATAENASEPASLAVTFPTKPPGSYQLLQTDYDNFAAVYSCSLTPFGKFEYIWVLTRAQQPTQETVEEARKVFADKGISLEKSELIDQGEYCSYEPNDGVTCDQKKEWINF